MQRPNYFVASLNYDLTEVFPWPVQNLSTLFILQSLHSYVRDEVASLAAMLYSLLAKFSRINSLLQLISSPTICLRCLIGSLFCTLTGEGDLSVELRSLSPKSPTKTCIFKSYHFP